MAERRVPGDLIGLGMLAVGFAAYCWMFAGVLPRPAHFAGDYSFFLPRLLAGHYHFVTNGPLHIPWFGPDQCGGLPFYADPQVPYFALPQWLTFAVGPVWGVVLSVYVMAAVGALGLYALMRNRFQASPAAAAIGAILFLFNGMYIVRMVEGHLSFQPFMLAPWAAWAVLAPAGSGRWQLTRTLGAVVATAMVFAIAFQGGMVHLLIPMALAVAAVVAIYGGREGHALRPWIILGAGGLTAMLLSMQRLVAAASYLSEFPRDYYPLPGFDNLIDSILIPLWALFWTAPADTGNERLANRLIQAGPHEWDFSVGPVAAALIVAGALALVVTVVRRGGFTGQAAARWALSAAILLVILAIPVLGNFYAPGWNAFLKELPLVASSVLMLRWYAVYILPAALAAALALDLLRRDARLLRAAAILVLVANTAWNASVDRSHEGRYPTDMETAGWQTARSRETVPPITDIAPIRIARHSGLAIGFSPLTCYQPMFGYRLEQFPRKQLVPGPALAVRNGSLNVKNPACYIFPNENGCTPGDHFRADERDKAELFLRYRNFPFERPAIQRIAGQINLWTPVALLLLLAVALALDLSNATGRARIERPAGHDPAGPRPARPEPGRID